MIHSDIYKFMAKTAGIYVGWYLLYEQWLLPDGRLDRWVAENIIHTTADLLRFIGLEVSVADRVIGLPGAPGILLVDGCTGISAIGLFAGFVIAYPGRWKSRAVFIGMGIGVIYLVNIARISLLVITQVYWPGLFNFTHDYSTTGIFYLVIFGLWMVWANISNGKQARD